MKPSRTILASIFLAACSQLHAATPEWIWASGQPKKVNFAKVFELSGQPGKAQLDFTCDNKAEVWVNGKSVGENRDWQYPVKTDVSKLLVKGKNLITAAGRDSGGQAGFVLRMTASLPNGKNFELVTDVSWLQGQDTPKGWPNAAGENWTSARSEGKYGTPPWGNALENQGGAGSAPLPTGPSFSVHEGFDAKKLYEVPKKEQGSWVSITADDKGRLIASAQSGSIFRITPQPIGKEETGEAKVEKIDLPTGNAQGLYFHPGNHKLYVSQNGGPGGSGFYIVEDTDGDDHFDKITSVRKLRGGGEHGPHAIVPAPDGQSLYIIAGNMTSIPDPEKSLVPLNWQEDQLLPRMPDARGHARSTMAPGGWIARTDLDGKVFELHTTGFRNPYDMAFNADGELFAYDADMEWDGGTPWYRPTRLCHAVSGGEFGWRNGSGKFPVFYEDSLPPVVNIGPGSPVGVLSGRGAKFPAKYQNAIYLLDWTYSTMWAVHLKPEGASYHGEAEEFVFGRPLPVSDAVINPVDGAMYFTVGGRGTQSALWRVTYSGKEPTTEANHADTKFASLRKIRQNLEALHKPSKGAVHEAWPYLAHEDRYIRFAARIAIEHQPVATWQGRALAEKDPDAAVYALLALARNGDKILLEHITQALGRIPFAQLDSERQLGLLRAFMVTFARMGKPSPALASQIMQKLDAWYPAASDALNHSLVNLLVYLDSPTVVAKTVPLMALATNEKTEYNVNVLSRNGGYARAFQAVNESQPQKQQIHYAYALRVATQGWTQDLRKQYFSWFNNAKAFKGGNSFGGFINNIRKEALSNVGDEVLRRELDSLSDELKGDMAVLPRPKGPGKNWTTEEVVGLLGNGLKGRDFDNGKNMFAAALCASCHRFEGKGGIGGPDLTGAGNRYSHTDLLDAITDPNKILSDQYQNSVWTMADGTQYTGKAVGEKGGKLQIMPTPIAPEHILEIDVSKIVKSEKSPISPMMPGLLNSLNQEEVLDLVAYMLSGGDKDHGSFR
jgi:putative heme-binding domain-containing protein